MTLAPQDLRQLDAAFRRRGMLAHMRTLARRELEPTLAAEWLRYLRIPPHQDDYPVPPRGAPCPRCGSRSPDRTATGTMLVVSFPGGWAERCLGCRSVWLHVERL